MAGVDRRKIHKRVRFAAGSRDNGTSEYDTGEGRSNYIYSQGNEYDSYEDNGDDNDDGLEADISSSRQRNRRINMDGYGSDASDQDEVVNMSDYSDDAEDQGVEEKAGNSDQQHVNEGNDDMFSDEQDNSPLARANGNADNKRKRYLGLDDIEGQEMSSTSRVDMAQDSFGLSEGSDHKGKQPAYATGDGLADRDSDEDSDIEGKGVTKIEAFNMRDDLEQGQFDAHGNFVWNKKDPNDYQDSWLDGVSVKAIKKARDSKVRQNQDQTVQESSLLRRWDTISNDDIIVAIINRLHSRETILSALARIGGPKKKSKNKWSKKAKAKKIGTAYSIDSEESEKERQRKKDIDELTELADQAMARGIVDIYDHTYEQLVRQMRMTNRIPEDWVPGTTLLTHAFAEEAKTDDTSNLDNKKEEEGGDGGLLDDLDDLGEIH
ncbi:hypothetical protein IW140_004720 [Coemansia sp. RSA 1813]|nr:hypothetical protein EV178_005404 [Coemansia sp. RSA 1646]KAJ1770406.1 hypothetical protein LPJ74_003213 [Coemansia sp. RSA 1843]KAJ2088222.1 hypothetical protein IW138_004394 [Coemansia sp. RSA 986]KAJ2215735.1 hypothetical protein EV179_001959 [Coemansia sp. RSA 487]KAJ2566929.1 hypothetical protein IW140_004720 [Coemansia sp. RSA 1813]